MTKIALLTDRAVLSLEGPDARTLLHGLVTNSIGEAPVYAALLSPQGKALAEMIITPDGPERLLLDVGADLASDLARRLAMYRLRLKVAISARPELGVYAGWDGPLPPGRPADPRLPALGARWIAPLGEPANATTDDYTRHRLALGVPEGSSEIGVDQTLWLETNAKELAGVDFAKGCYVGQENTARMNYRNKVRRRLLPLKVAGAPEDAPAVMAGDKEAGTIRRRMGDLAMAWMRLEFVETAAPLTVGGVPAALITPDYLA